MPYVQIEDPAIIDVSALHQIIQVVNEHSDSIAALTNNFGASSSITQTDADGGWASTFDSGTQLIQFGRAKVTASGGLASETVNFAADFSGTPVITATASTTNPTPGYVAKVQVVAVSTTEFTIKTEDSGATSTFSVNWIAIGPK